MPCQLRVAGLSKLRIGIVANAKSNMATFRDDRHCERNDVTAEERHRPFMRDVLRQKIQMRAQTFERSRMERHRTALTEIQRKPQRRIEQTEIGKCHRATHHGNMPDLKDRLDALGS